MERLLKASIALALCPLVVCGCWSFRPMEPERVLFDANFATDPAGSGWIAQAPEQGGERPSWRGAGAGVPHIAAAASSWESPPIPVEPFHYYRLAFRSRADGNAYWAAVFYDAGGTALPADHCSGFFPSGDWVTNTFCFRARARAATVGIRFWPIGGKALRVTDVAVSSIPRKAAAEWADAVYATIPPVTYTPPAGRWAHLPRTRQRLAHGGTLRIVMLGDSIVNDTSNSAIDVLLERLYPGATVRVITSVRGGTGCAYYREGDRVRDYVVAYQPDLLIIGGISHGGDAEPVRSVIRQVRAAIDPEILAMTGAICPRAQVDKNLAEWAERHGVADPPTVARYQQALERVAREEGVAFLDLRAAWDAYVAGSGKPDEWFLRDPVHANARAGQAVARILTRYLGPEAD